ncbi:MAG TPA: hypothetical protein GXZ53_09215 [Firmicutes bacterium]|nr:hypothetical protein [Bacillota bacterium]
MTGRAFIKKTKRILTPFGIVRYQRRYYRHKQTNEYRYLVDEKMGVVRPHTRVDANLKARFVLKPKVS